MLPEPLILLWWLVQYSYSMAMLTVTAVEAPDSRVTDSLRTTIRHFRTDAGLAFFFRGFPLFIIYDFTWSVILPTLLPTSTTNPWTARLGSVLYVALLANLQVLWVHTVISKPSAKYIHQRLPGLTCWVRIAPIAVLEAVVHWLVGLYSMQLTILLLDPVIDVEGLLDGAVPNSMQRGYALPSIGLVPCFVTCMATLPARTVLIRMAASMLPDDEHPIVPIDPSLKSNPRAGGLDTWRSIPGGTWAKVWRIQAQAYVLSAGVFFAGKMTYGDFHKFASTWMMWFNNF
ncbi:hypothetical protein BJX61DRAFT_544721 [Aspergillus egyptiacus]|nr:hypothetical protein BJX61DRAFT_544721 [Aspergillus egyptiacus]